MSSSAEQQAPVEDGSEADRAVKRARRVAFRSSPPDAAHRDADPAPRASAEQGLGDANGLKETSKSSYSAIGAREGSSARQTAAHAARWVGEAGNALPSRAEDDPSAHRPLSPKWDGFQDGCPSLVFGGASRVLRASHSSWRAGGDSGDSESEEEDHGAPHGSTAAMPSRHGIHQSDSIAIRSQGEGGSALSESRASAPMGWQTFEAMEGTRVLRPRHPPPRAVDVALQINPRVCHQQPFFSEAADLPERQRVVMHNRTFHFESAGVRSLCDFNCSTPASEPRCSACRRGFGVAQRTKAKVPAVGRLRVLETVLPPPSPASVRAWWFSHQVSDSRHPGASHGDPAANFEQDPTIGRWRHVERGSAAATRASASKSSRRLPDALLSERGVSSCSQSSAGGGSGCGPLSQSSADEGGHHGSRRTHSQGSSNQGGGEAAPDHGTPPSDHAVAALEPAAARPLPRPLSAAKPPAKRPLPGVTQVSAATLTEAPSVRDASGLHTSQNLTIFAFEAHVSTQGHMTPNVGRRANAEQHAADGDEIQFVWYAVKEDRPSEPDVSKMSHQRGAHVDGGTNSGSGHASDIGNHQANSVRQGVVLRVDAFASRDDAERSWRRYHGRLLPQWRVDEVRMVVGEVELLQELAAVVRTVDADVLLNWDTKNSIGFLVERANVLGIEPPLLRQLGRTPEHRGANEEQSDEWGEQVNSSIHVTGRVIINLWRCARSELAISQYTLQNVAAKVLQERVPLYTYRALTQWWNLRANDVEVPPAAAGNFIAAGIDSQKTRPPRRDDGRVRVLSHFASRVSLTLRIADAMETIARTSELARVFGIDFTSVITRGSQYRVESMLLRLCHSQGYVCASPEQAQIQKQPAPQSIALILEPEGKLYTSPVIVLDFRSLYPSVIIAYNICYSTCLGSLNSLTRMLEDRGAVSHRFGCLEISARGLCTSAEASAARTPAAQVYACLQRLSRGIPLSPALSCNGVTDGESGKMAGDGVESSGSCNGGSDRSSESTCGLHAAPNGMLFTSKASRPGILPRLLREILETRFMVKRAMKQVPVGSALHRTLNARQFGLKLIANVTYGYTSASFSGRMPSVHLADAIVQTGRDTLQRTIELVNGHPSWGARVVYGDTDSLFVLMEGRSRAEAFRVGREIAASVTAANPHPMELEMEKVYHPCVLCTKKRYAGYMYESETSAPKFDAKGVETQRRDGCPAERKILEKCLRLLFAKGDLSAVKAYVLRQCDKLHTGRASIIDYIFAQEVRLGSYKSEASAPQGAHVAMHRMQIDPNDRSQPGERVPYVVINRQETARLRDSAQRPEVLLFPSPGAQAGGGWVAPELNAPYYLLKRILPMLHRVFSLIGVDVFRWYKVCCHPHPRCDIGLHGVCCLSDGPPGGAMPCAQMEMRRSKRPPLDRPLPALGQRAGTIVGYMKSNHCVLCDQQCREILCDGCLGDGTSAMLTLAARQRIVQRRFDDIVRHCLSCARVRSGPVECRNLDCPHLYARLKLQRQNETAAAHAQEALAAW